MPFDNYEARHFTEQEITKIESQLQALEDSLSVKLANLTAEERQRMGSVRERNKLFINKAKVYHDTLPQLSSPDVDWKEFDRDYASREEIGGLILRLKSLTRGLENARILHDWDNYHAALTDYQYSRYKRSTSTPGYETKVGDMAQFFSKKGKSGTPAPDSESGEASES